MAINRKKQGGGGDLPLTYSSVMKEEHFCYTNPLQFLYLIKRCGKEETMVKVTRKKHRTTRSLRFT